MRKRIYIFLKECKIFYHLQIGYQESNSIDHALISVTEEIRPSLDSRRYGCGIFLDLQKAFDTVNHGILLKITMALEETCLSGLSQIYLKEVNFFQYKGSSSSLMRTSCGVPQGSVLRPQLFLIYVNDLPNVSKKLKFYLFADHTNIYCDCDTPANLAKMVNWGFTNVKRWLD